MDRNKENVIEWIEGSKTATCTFSQKKFINRITKMAEKGGSPVEILAKKHGRKHYSTHSCICGAPLRFFVEWERDYGRIGRR